jgi:hypothetical protein
VHIGIDPGLQGAVAILDDAGALVALHDVPTLTVPTSRGSRQEYDLPAMAALLAPSVPHGHVVIEEAQAMPGQGVRSMLTIGLGFGAWLGVIGALGLAHTRTALPRGSAAWAFLARKRRHGYGQYNSSLGQTCGGSKITGAPRRSCSRTGAGAWRCRQGRAHEGQ